jgi:ADP-heptose:LPS heptosyltransferase
MIAVEIIREITIYGNYVLEKGKVYVMPQTVKDQIERIYPRSSRFIEGFFEKTGKFLDISKLNKGEEVFIFRSGGIGDILFMHPLIRYLKEEFGAKIKMGTSPMYFSVYNNDPWTDKRIVIPFDINELKNSNWYVMFEGVIEDINSEMSQQIHAVDLFFMTAGINPLDIDPSKKIPVLTISDDEKKRGMKVIKSFSNENKKIGIQINASSKVRSFPIEKIIDLIIELIKNNYQVYIFGGKNQKNDANYIEEVISVKIKNIKEQRHFVNLINYGLNIRDSIIICEFMDLMIAPDSSFVHIAGSLGIPVIGLYGCFPSILRMKYYNKAIGIDCSVQCSPSFIHGHAACPNGDPSPCFSVISIKNIMDAVSHLIGEKTTIYNEYPEYNEFLGGKPIKVIDGVLNGNTEKKKEDTE